MITYLPHAHSYFTLQQYVPSVLVKETPSESRRTLCQDLNNQEFARISEISVVIDADVR